MIYIFDIDGTICKTNGNDYYTSIPNPEIIKIINELKNKDNYIIIQTARGSTTGKDWREFTKMQLDEWGVHYDELRFVKMPLEYLIVNDKACNPKHIREFI